MASVKAPSKKPTLGGQDLNYCCVLAVNEWLGRQGCQDTVDVQVSRGVLAPGLVTPCGVQFRDANAGAPYVEVSYRWSKINCPGWQLSASNNTTQWLQTLVGFLLPSIVFTFNIPRRRKLKVWGKLLPAKIGSYRILTDLISGLVAFAFVAIDTIFWLCTVFAATGPLLLSGLHEAWIDKRVVEFLDVKIQNRRMPLALRARILFGILCGNLELYPAYCDVSALAESLDHLDSRNATLPPLFPAGSIRSLQRRRSEDGSITAPHILLRDSRGQSDATWREHSGQRTPTESDLSHTHTPSHIDQHGILSHTTPTVAEGLPHSPLRNAQAEDPTCETPQAPLNRHGHTHSLSPSMQKELESEVGERQSFSQPKPLRTQTSALSRNAEGSITAGDLVTSRGRNVAEIKQRTIDKVALRLKAMLSCQYSFGSTIGGPILFYAGAFIYALLEIKEQYGNNDVAHALAFGMWWTVIPHVAIVAGFLLAGNNPNTVEGIVAAKKSNYVIGDMRVRPVHTFVPHDTESQARQGSKAYSSFFERVYEADYTPASLWNRGRSKQTWLLVLCVDSLARYKASRDFNVEVLQPMAQLIEIILMSSADWLYLSLFASLLIFVPSLLGILMAYWTPQIGFSCRSLTILVFLAAQTLLLFLWFLRITWRDPYWCQGRRIKRHLTADGYLKIDDAAGVEEFRKDVSKMIEMAKFDTQVPRQSGSWCPGYIRTLLYSSAAQESQIWPLCKQTMVAEWLHFSFCTLGFSVAVFVGIGGTLMQVIGVYRNCLCKINVPSWHGSARLTSMLLLSVSTPQEINQAQKYWFTLGGVSIGVLAGSCCVGWWYQKRLRVYFKTVAGRMNQEAKEEVDRQGWVVSIETIKT